MTAIASIPLNSIQWLFGVPFFLLAVVLTGQMFITTKRGYIYCGRSSTVSKKENPAKYKLWFYLHIIMICLVLIFSSFPYWS